MRLALFQPDIPQNTGAVIRLTACLGIPLSIIEPCGFPLDDRRLARVALDYGVRARIDRHRDWDDFQHWRREALPETLDAVRAPGATGGGRLALLTTRGETSLYAYSFRPGDILLMGRESAGAPPHVHDAADVRLAIPMAAGARSLNIAMAAAIALSEALRQTGRLGENQSAEESQEETSSVAERLCDHAESA